jgi:hypothetical protein
MEQVQRVMLGLFGIFGRSQDLQRIDDALRGLRASSKPYADAVKLTMLKQLKEANGGRSPGTHAVLQLRNFWSTALSALRNSAKQTAVARTEAAESHVLLLPWRPATALTRVLSF